MTKRNRILCLFISMCLLLAILPGSTGSVFAVTTPDTASANAARSTASTLAFYFDNYYHANSFGISKRQHINTAVAFVNMVYQQACDPENIDISYASSGSPVAETVTDIDDCPLGIDSPCAMTSICGGVTYHHKDIRRIADQLYNSIPRQPNHITVLWSDPGTGNFCYNRPVLDSFGEPTGQYVHEYSGYCAVVFEFRPVIHIMDLQFPDTAAQIAARMSLLLAHETMHTFGIGDSYGEQAEHEEDDLRTCVMDYSEIQNGTDVTFYNNVLLERTNALCDYCQTALINKIQFGY